MSLTGVSSVTAGIVSTQKRELPNCCKSEIPKKYDTFDKLVKQKSDEAKEVPAKERTLGNWAAIAVDYIKNTLLKPVIMSSKS